MERLKRIELLNELPPNRRQRRAAGGGNQFSKATQMWAAKKFAREHGRVEAE